jgi:competence protein ComGC
LNHKNVRGGIRLTGLVAVVMIFSIPIIAIITNHFQNQSKIKHKMIKDELKLEKLKHENYLIETEKMRLELEQMRIGDSSIEKKIL